MIRTLRNIVWTAAAGVLCLPLLTPVAVAQKSSRTAATMKMSKSAAPAGPVTEVEGRMVCMVNNKAFDKPQIPVRVHGRTYYGCCAMCKHLLQTAPSNRVAIDPVSKRKVDKSQAVIGKDVNGAVVYFQNDADMRKYNARFAR